MVDFLRIINFIQMDSVHREIQDDEQDFGIVCAVKNSKDKDNERGSTVVVKYKRKLEGKRKKNDVLCANM